VERWEGRREGGRRKGVVTAEETGILFNSNYSLTSNSVKYAGWKVRR